MSLEQLKIEDIVVMLVEPSTTQQKIIRNQLEEVGITNIIIHKTGAETLTDLPDARPDVVISALYLADMTGTDLVHRMRENENTEDIGFIN